VAAKVKNGGVQGKGNREGGKFGRTRKKGWYRREQKKSTENKKEKITHEGWTNSQLVNGNSWEKKRQRKKAYRNGQSTKKAGGQKGGGKRKKFEALGWGWKKKA